MEIQLAVHITIPLNPSVAVFHNLFSGDCRSFGCEIGIQHKGDAARTHDPHRDSGLGSALKELRRFAARSFSPTFVKAANHLRNFSFRESHFRQDGGSFLRCEALKIFGTRRNEESGHV